MRRLLSYLELLLGNRNLFELVLRQMRQPSAPVANGLFDTSRKESNKGSGRRTTSTRFRSVFLSFLFSIFLFLNVGCGVPGYDKLNPTAATTEGIAAVVEQVNIVLSSGDCASALAQIDPIYQSINSGNDVRLAEAGTYGCFATINLLNILTDLQNFSGNLAGSGFWEFLVQEFPSTASDRIPQSAMDGTDALLAAIKPGTVLLPQYIDKTDTNNVKSFLPSDRVDDANSYLTFVSMALMGSLQSRYGLPTSNHHKSQTLPWTSSTAVTTDGCAFASAVLNFNDGLKFIIDASPPAIAKFYTTIKNALTAGLDPACAAGCSNPLDCNDSSLCSGCPISLRNRNACTSLNTDANSCAASGLVNFVNSAWTGPP